jgi:glycosyltransferase 2 family protein
MRKFIVALALLLGIVFIFTRLAEVQAVAETLQRGDWRFVLLAIGVEVIWMFNVAVSYQTIYRTMGLDEKLERLVLMATAAYFVNIVAPSGGVGGVAVFISQARRRGYSPAKVTMAGVVFVLFEYLGFLVILSLGLIVLFRRNHLTMVEISASAILVSIALVMAILIFLGMRSADALGRALAWMARLANKLLRPFIHREYLSEQRAHGFARDGSEGLHALRQKPTSLLLLAALGLSSKLLMLIIFWLMFLAFKVDFSPGTLIAGFSVGYLFWIVSPTPAGIGFVEGALTLALRSLNVPLAAATILALSYRGVIFWLPLLFGLVAFRWLEKSERDIKTPV